MGRKGTGTMYRGLLIGYERSGMGSGKLLPGLLIQRGRLRTKEEQYNWQRKNINTDSRS
jgi:hypothetical protein